MIETLLKTLKEELQLPELPKRDAQHFYAFFLNPEMEIKVKELDPGMVLFGVIGPCPQVKKEELFTHLMKANFLGQGTGGGSIALDADENSLTLSCVFPYDMNYKMFRDALEDFANYIDYWKAELFRHVEAAEEGRI
ncbi:MAG TPA: type III secretion system chaperone [Rhabdochlamydiaceae bacterium]|jgi:hypothetical protein